MGMAENNIEWGARGEIDFNIKSNLNKKLLFRQAVLYTFGQDCCSLLPVCASPWAKCGRVDITFRPILFIYLQVSTIIYRFDKQNIIYKL